MSVGKRLFGGSLVSPSAAKSVSPEKRVETIALEEVDEDVNAEGDRSLAEKQTQPKAASPEKVIDSISPSPNGAAAAEGAAWHSVAEMEICEVTSTSKIELLLRYFLGSSWKRRTKRTLGRNRTSLSSDNG